MSLVDPGSGSRADDVVECLVRRGGSATSSQVASDLGIHPSTARFHLDRLVERGRVTTGQQHRTTRGRPRTVFTLRPDTEDGPRAYRLLAAILVEDLARRDDPSAAALEAGRQWGGTRRGDLLATLDEMGFAPAAGGADISLRHCPFLDLASDHPDVVCTLHRGVVEGMTGRSADLTSRPGRVCVLRPA